MLKGVGLKVGGDIRGRGSLNERLGENNQEGVGD